MSYADDMIDQMLMEEAMRHMWDGSEEETTIDEYIRTVSLNELLQATRETLHSLPPELMYDVKVVRARDILNKGTIYGRLSYKQKYALGLFIDCYE
ncbi:hypothetical protein CPT_Mater217 [Bacillus phage Mater]|uniref:Uncharacterized protein n=1 Tax=Bacillus phage Mater TaxID=1540090 RepID=A0A0A0RP13_9CAUD|nr:hypothetical protein CPT_Mater217 [Bacillus phage Mater]AIW03374.1 hypothetical protein CPT_Mater217 [Bacillus phage Mater]